MIPTAVIGVADRSALSIPDAGLARLRQSLLDQAKRIWVEIIEADRASHPCSTQPVEERVLRRLIAQCQSVPLSERTAAAAQLCNAGRFIQLLAYDSSLTFHEDGERIDPSKLQKFAISTMTTERTSPSFGGDTKQPRTELALAFALIGVDLEGHPQLFKIALTQFVEILDHARRRPALTEESFRDYCDGRLETNKKIMV